MFSVKLGLDLQERGRADGDIAQPDLGFVVQEGAREGICVQRVRDDSPFSAHAHTSLLSDGSSCHIHSETLAARSSITKSAQ